MAQQMNPSFLSQKQHQSLRLGIIATAAEIATTQTASNYGRCISFPLMRTVVKQQMLDANLIVSQHRIRGSRLLQTIALLLCLGLQTSQFLACLLQSLRGSFLLSRDNRSLQKKK
jgi:hypothetical protein